MIFSTLQSDVLNLDQWQTQHPSHTLDDLWGKKPHTIVNQATTFWMEQHHKQLHVRTMGSGLQQHLCAQVSPSVTNSCISELEALRERRPPWTRQIITPILPTVKMLSLGCERLPTPLKKGVLDHYLHHDLGMLPLLWCFFCSFTHLTIPRSPPKFNQFFLVLLRTRP